MIAAGVLLAATPARAQSSADKETARTLFEEGKTKRDRGDAAGALASFRAADAIMNVPTTKLAVARAHAALGQLTEAREAALAVALIPAAPNEPAPFVDARGAAAKLSTELSDRIPSVAIVVEGAPKDEETIVTVDGAVVPKEAWGFPRRLNPGKHTIVAKVRGREVKNEVSLNEKQMQSVTLDVTSIAAAAPAADAAARPEAQPAKGPLSPLVWGGLGVAAVGVGLGTITGVVSMNNASELDVQCRDGRCPPGAHGSLDAAQTWATVSTVSFIVAGLGAGVATVGFFMGRKAPSEAAPGSSTAAVTPVIGLGTAGIAGRF
jgi:hypothetical protein